MFDDSGATIPSGIPVPYFSGFLDILFSCAYETVTPIAEPAAGIAPTKAPISAPRIAIGHKGLISLHGGKSRFIAVITSSFFLPNSIDLSTSARPKMPTATGTIEIPPCR